MATEIVTTVIDDINGQSGAQTRTFGLGNDTFEIDLIDTTWESLCKALKKYVDKGRRVGHPQPQVKRKRTQLPVASNVKAVRDWARLNGYPDVNSRGRIAKEIQDKYDAAHP